MDKKGLNANILKLIAVISMTLDHFGLLILPNALWLRAVGRLAFPIFAFMVGEGCRHTRSLPKYLSTMGVFAAVCQAVNYIATGSVYQCIFVTFFLSIALFYVLSLARKLKPALGCLLGVLAVFAVYFITEILPLLLKGTDYGVDYSFFGVMLPVVFALGRSRWQKLLTGGVLLTLFAFTSPAVQWYALLSLPLLALYNGQRGKWNLKWFFYLYYPAHLAALYLLVQYRLFP